VVGQVRHVDVAGQLMLYVLLLLMIIHIGTCLKQHV